MLLCKPARNESAHTWGSTHMNCFAFNLPLLAALASIFSSLLQIYGMHWEDAVNFSTLN